MQQNHFITPEIMGMVGREEVFSSPEELGRAIIHRFAVAIGDNNPLYYDEAYAKETPYGGIIAPPTMIFELNHNIGDEISEDGGYSSIVRLPGFSNFVRGGNEYEIFQPVRPTDKITVKQKIAEVYEKEGKGSSLIFALVEIKYFNQKSELLGINRETLIFMPKKEAGENR